MHKIKPYFYLAPSLALLVGFLLYPALGTFEYSLTDWGGLADYNMIGFKNYQALFQDPYFWDSLRITLIWVAMCAAILPVTGMILGLMVEYLAPTRLFAGASRTILFMPMMVSTVAIGLLWALIYNPTFGLLNEALKALGIIDNRNLIEYLGNGNRAIYWMFLSAIWQWSGFGMMITCATLMSIPKDLMEAAHIDGANKFQTLWHIVTPMLVPMLLTRITIDLIGGFKSFDLIYVATSGGPGVSTRVMSIYMYTKSFLTYQYGYGSTIASVMFVIVVILTVLFNRFSDRVNKRLWG
jgi:ABC-type sugar transport system permease subunit